MFTVKNNPNAILGTSVEALDPKGWEGCYPVVSNGIVVGVQTISGEVLAGRPGSLFDEKNDWFIMD